MSPEVPPGDSAPPPSPPPIPQSDHDDHDDEKYCAKCDTKALNAKLDRHLQSLQEELRGLQKRGTENAPGDLKRRIRMLRNMARNVKREGEDSSSSSESGSDDESGPDDNAPSPKPDGEEDKRYSTEEYYEIKRFTMEEYHAGAMAKDRALAVYYRNVPGRETEQGDRGTGSRGGQGRQEHPQRITIHSLVLGDELRDITGIDLPDGLLWLPPPFKLLTRYAPQIADRLAELQQQVGQNDVPESSASGPSGSDSDQGRSTSEKPSLSPSSAKPKPGAKSDQEPVTGKLRTKPAIRLRHLQLLHDFINAELAHYLDLTRSISAGTIEKIAFEHLWFLFQPGGLVLLRKQGHYVLGRTFAVTGGQQQKKNYATDGRNPDTFRPEHTSHNYVWDLDGLDRYGPYMTCRSGSTSLGKDTVGDWTLFTVDYYIMECDGTDVGPMASRERIKHYFGERAITDLPVYPLRFHPDAEAVTRELVARGRKYITAHGHKSYRGTAILTGSNDRGPSRRQDPDIWTPAYAEELRSDIYIDRAHCNREMNHNPILGALQRTPQEAAERVEYVQNEETPFTDDQVDCKATEDFLLANRATMDAVEMGVARESEEYLQLFPMRLPAFVFRTRQHVYIDIQSVSDIDKSDEAQNEGFEDLVIPDTHRSLLIALVKNHVSEPTAREYAGEPADGGTDEPAFTQIDIVRGKGRGLIILLHGPPGSGKTSTAETLAAYTRRPLYPITCGDLGTVPEDVERSLTEHTGRAQRWGCVLLLDEADVFLTQRDKRDMARNALVSVFLRQLEYYSGILFLTTNRVGLLDEAFKSRIHVSLAYPSIRLPQTLEIWNKTLDRLERENKTAETPVRFDRSALLRWAEAHYKMHERSGTTWNGRQIRNSFQLAIALGRYARDTKPGVGRERSVSGANGNGGGSGSGKKAAVKLTVASFRSIAKTANDFEDYLTQLRGNDSHNAKEAFWRYDGYDEDMGPELRAPPVKDYGRQRSPMFRSGRGDGALTPTPGSRRAVGREYSGSASNSGRRDRERDRSRGRDWSSVDGRDDDEQEGDDDIFEEGLSDDD